MPETPDRQADDLAALGLSCVELFDEVPCWISIQDRQFNIIKASRKLTADFGEHRRTKCYALYKQRTEPCVECVVERTFENGREHTSQDVLFDRRGLPHDMQVTTQPLRNRDGQVVAVMKVFADVTSEKSLTQRLRNSLLRFQNVLDNAPCYITVQNRDRRILEANRRFEESFGKAEGATCYQTCKNYEAPCPDCPVEQTFCDGQVHNHEEVLVDNQGREVHVLAYTAPIREATGEITSVVEMSTDVTEVRTLQNQLAQLGQLVGGVAHSAKNILEGLRGGVYIVNLGFRNQRQEDIRTGWEMVERNVGRLSTVILDMLHCARDRAPRQLPVSIPAIVKDVVALFAPNADGFRIKLHAQADEPLDLAGEPKDIHSLIANLITNAIDACNADQDEEKAHQISLRAYRDRDQAVIEVEDNGRGMTAAIREALFKNMVSTKDAGTGLGLLTAHRVATEHGGSIAVRSDPRTGSVFIVKLPIRQPDGSSA